uniref:Uncharacterized protein n=1 Tax=Avena sativa TaxID=4498 RepID=A0ACD5VKA7_AVESA
MKMINASGKDLDAQKFVDNLKDRYGNGISTKCLIYNATGKTLSLQTYNDWTGHIYDSPYPSDILNGQWGAFLHVHPAGSLVGSFGAVVYRITGVCDLMFGWGIPYIGDNAVHTEIQEEGFFPLYNRWGYVKTMLETQGYTSTDNRYGYVSKAEIGEGTSVNARAVFQLA